MLSVTKMELLRLLIQHYYSKAFVKAKESVHDVIVSSQVISTLCSLRVCSSFLFLFFSQKELKCVLEIRATRISRQSQ
ncbi:hypothetical protein Syun_021590 [Stephania yunnanensis]|uniref:Uncharacterized protein n=1 Tax=Stephania yunnanensis TaxID=152371 RepID=A0AAP0IG13_9MAGN